MISYLALVIINLVIIEAILASIKKYRATMLGVVNSVRFTSSIVSPMIAAYLLTSVGMRLTLIIVALLVIPNLFIVHRIAKSIEAKERRISFRDMLRRYRYATLFVVLVSLGSIPGSMYMVYENIIGVYIGEFPPWVIGCYEFLESLLVALLMPLGGYFIDRIRWRYLVPALSDSLAIPYATCVLLGSWLKSYIVYLLAPLPDALIASFSSATITLFKDLKAPTKQLLILHTSLSDIIAAITTLTAGFILDYLGVLTTLIIVSMSTIIIILVDLTIVINLYNKAVKAT